MAFISAPSIIPCACTVGRPRQVARIQSSWSPPSGYAASSARTARGSRGREAALLHDMLRLLLHPPRSGVESFSHPLGPGNGEELPQTDDSPQRSVPRNWWESGKGTDFRRAETPVNILMATAPASGDLRHLLCVAKAVEVASR